MKKLVFGLLVGWFSKYTEVRIISRILLQFYVHKHDEGVDGELNMSPSPNGAAKLNFVKQHWSLNWYSEILGDESFLGFSFDIRAIPLRAGISI